MFNEKIFEAFCQTISKDYRGALVSPGSNFYYLTGLNPISTLERLFILVVPAGKEPIIIAPQMYEEEIKASWKGRAIFWDDSLDPYEILKGILDSTSKEQKKWLVEDTMEIVTFYKIRQSAMDIDFMPLSTVISGFRVIKNSKEIEFHKKAGEIVDQVYYKIIEEGLKGKTEREAAVMIENLIKSYGADISFDAMVASGPNGANPHHAPCDRVISKGDLVVLDYGAKYKGYCSDITRTVAIGEIPDEAKRIYEVVREAQHQGIGTVGEGKTAKEIDSVVRKVISDCGYGKYFTHRTGHGLGLEIHEEPYIAPNSDSSLRNGMVFTIEPGIYLPGKFGVRIENDVAIVNGKGKKLTEAETGLFVL